MTQAPAGRRRQIGARHPAAGVALCLVPLAACVQTAAIDPADPVVDPEALMGRAPAAVLADLGEPELQRREPPVEVWQYRSDACVFDVFFDVDSDANADAGGGTSAPVVVYYEARSRGSDSGPADPPRCLSEIIAASRATPAS